MMNLVKRTPSTNLLPSVMEELFTPLWLSDTENFNTRMVPPVNIKETDKTYEVELSAPGKKKQDFNIEIDDELLTISSEFKNEKTEEVGKFTRKEFSYSSFMRSFALPENVKQENIKAAYDNGILRITLPKSKEVAPKHKKVIDIL